MYAVYDRWLGNKREKAKERSPTILISGSATWTLKQSNASLDALDEYRRNVSGVAGLMDRLTKLGTQVNSLCCLIVIVLVQAKETESQQYSINSEITELSKHLEEQRFGENY